MNIRKIKNGYIVTDERGSETFAASAQELFEQLLSRLESRGKFFGGDSYGAVFVATKPGDTFTAPPLYDPA